MAHELTVDTPAMSLVTAEGRPAKVLQVGKYYPPHMGGIETHLHTLCTSLRDVADVRAVVASGNAQAESVVLDQVPVERVATPFTLASAPLCPGMVSRIRHSAADLIHVHLPNPTAVLAYLASGHRGPLVVTYHSDTVRQAILGPAFNPILHRFLRRSTAIIATSPNYLATSNVLARHRDRCHVIPYGIPLSQFESCDAASVDRVRRQFGERLVLGVGRLVYYKGFEYAIEAMRNVRGRLLLAGTGPLLEKLQALAVSRGVGDRVVFLGEIQNNDITPYYHAADAFILPSIARSEAFGIVQIEAMAAGRPVINTSLDSGVPFVSQDGITGLTIPPEDPQALASAINRLFDDRDLRERLGTAAQRRAAQEFSVGTMLGRVVSLYQNILDKAPGPVRQNATVSST
jgi:glycosyltransferase involved in cell wall biosynthesis